MPDPQPFAVAPLEAIAYLRDKLDVPTATWTDLWEGMHARAFVVAGAQGEELLADFHDAVNRAIEEGRTLDQFRDDFDRIVARYGWSYNGTRNWRSAVIFNTNLRMATSAGRWAQIQRVKAHRPYLRYVAVMDGRTRPLHRLWHDTVLPVDHPWWQTHCPPNGWNCRCSLQSLSARDLTRYGLEISPEPPASPLVERTVNTPAGPRQIRVPIGIDPGFAYNPGEAAFGRGAEALALEKHGPWTPLETPGAPEPLAPLPVSPPSHSWGGAGGRAAPAEQADLRATLRQALGGDEAILPDPTGTRIRLGQALVDWLLADPSRLDGRERYLPLLPELVTDPAEIRLGWTKSAVTGRVELRRRYVKLFDLGLGRTIGLAADADGSELSGWTVFWDAVSAVIRSGLLISMRD